MFLSEVATQERMGNFCLLPGSDRTQVTCFKHGIAVSYHILYYMARNIHAVNKIAEGMTGKIKCDSSAYAKIVFDIMS